MMIPINVIIFGYHFIRATNELNTNSFEKYSSKRGLGEIGEKDTEGTQRLKGKE